MFRKYCNLKTYYAVCSKVTKLKFTGGFHKAHQSVFDELDKYGIHVPSKDRIFPHFITYDFEAVLQKLNRDPSHKLVWEEKHIPISVGVGSNVPGFTNSICFVNYDLDGLLDEMIDHMHTIGKRVKDIQKEKFAQVFQRLEAMLEQFKDSNLVADSDISNTSSSSSQTATSVTFNDSTCEVDDYEPPSKKFAKRVNKPNSFDQMIGRLQDTNELLAQYHDFSSDEDEFEEELLDNAEEEDRENTSPRAKFAKNMYRKI